MGGRKIWQGRTNRQNTGYIARAVEVTVEREGAEESPAHCIAAGGEQSQDSEDLIDWAINADMPALLPPSSELSSYPEWPTYLDFPHTLPLLPPPISPATSALPPLLPGSPSAHPQPTILAVGSPRVFPSPSAIMLSALPPPWHLPPSAPPWATIMAVAWVSPGSSCSKSLLSPSWLLPPSSPPWTLLGDLLPVIRPPP